MVQRERSVGGAPLRASGSCAREVSEANAKAVLVPSLLLLPPSHLLLLLPPHFFFPSPTPHSLSLFTPLIHFSPSPLPHSLPSLLSSFLSPSLTSFLPPFFTCFLPSPHHPLRPFPLLASPSTPLTRASFVLLDGSHPSFIHSPLHFLPPHYLTSPLPLPLSHSPFVFPPPLRLVHFLFFLPLTRTFLPLPFPRPSLPSRGLRKSALECGCDSWAFQAAHFPALHWRLSWTLGSAGSLRGPTFCSRQKRASTYLLLVQEHPKSNKITKNTYTDYIIHFCCL